MEFALLVYEGGVTRDIAAGWLVRLVVLGVLLGAKRLEAGPVARTCIDCARSED